MFPLRPVSQLVALSACAVLGSSLGAQSSQTPPTFRASVDLIAVDVEVVDAGGHPVVGLRPDMFTVSIDGRRHRVVTADLISYGSPSGALKSSALTGPDQPGALGAGAPAGRVLILAVDSLSFNLSASRGIISAARDFVLHLLPEDRVGLFVFPIGPHIDATTNHAAILRALDTVVGMRDSPTPNVSRFNLRPSELIELSVGSPGLVRRLCGNPPDAECPTLLTNEVLQESLYFEGQAQASIGQFRGLLQSLGTLAARTTVVLLSAGIIASDVPGGRPDLGDFGVSVGKDATRSNVTLYALFFDQSWMENASPETRRARNTLIDLQRDSQVLGRWLEQVAGTAGGALIKVLSGNGEAAFDRVLSETSAYYLLGVEPARDDRDGRPHDLSVKVAARSATVRGRKWVMVPRPSARSIETSTPEAPSVVPARPAPAALPAHAPSPELAPIVKAFQAGDDETVMHLVRASSDPEILIREAADIGGRLGSTSRRDALFALEIGLAGLQSRRAGARQASARLLVQYGTLIRQPTPDDGFECAWFMTEAAGLPAAFEPAATLVLIQQARQRCPAEPRLALTAAILTEQQWSLRPLPLLPGDAMPPVDTAREREVSRAYETAAAVSGDAAEAEGRAAWFYARLGRLDKAEEWLNRITSTPADPELRYMVGLIRGQVWRALGRNDAAALALREAMSALPDGTAARTALMTLLLATNRREEAESLAIALQSTADRRFDPWWGYWLGDLARSPARLRRLRELAR